MPESLRFDDGSAGMARLAEGSECPDEASSGSASARSSCCAWRRATPSSGTTTSPGSASASTPPGRKVYVVQTRGPDGPRRVSLGRHGEISVDEARRRARSAIDRLKRGEDPSAAARAYGRGAGGALSRHPCGGALQAGLRQALPPRAPPAHPPRARRQAARRGRAQRRGGPPPAFAGLSLHREPDGPGSLGDVPAGRRHGGWSRREAIRAARCAITRSVPAGGSSRRRSIAGSVRRSARRRRAARHGHRRSRRSGCCC